MDQWHGYQHLCHRHQSPWQLPDLRNPASGVCCEVYIGIAPDRAYASKTPLTGRSGRMVSGARDSAPQAPPKLPAQKAIFPILLIIMLRLQHLLSISGLLQQRLQGQWQGAVSASVDMSLCFKSSWCWGRAKALRDKAGSSIQC